MRDPAPDLLRGCDKLAASALADADYRLSLCANGEAVTVASGLEAERMTSKYGVPLPLETYQGWPLRVGDFAAHGKREGLVAANDAVLVWSGGASDVTLQARPYRYVIERRIERAKSLLRARRRPSPRSPCCGFASQAHLNSAFKARTGVTPGVYRKR